MQEVALAPGRWSEAHRAFDAVRDLVLAVETGAVKMTLPLIGTLYVAENVAQVSYNATSPPDPFDDDSAHWIVVNVYWVVSLLRRPEATARAWQQIADIRRDATNPVRDRNIL